MFEHKRVSSLLGVALVLGSCAVPAQPAPAVAAPPAASATTPATPELAERIRVTEPAAGVVVTSPLRIRGEARGGWYFEATFPVVLLDSDDKELGKHYATADGEWMTEAWVAFTAQLTFAAPTTPTGTLILQRANASGLPEHDAALRVPVRFAH
jgi:hypothetical protein